MKEVKVTRLVDIPSNVTVECNARKVKVTGPRGTLNKQFVHTKCDIRVVNGGKKVQVSIWLGNKKQVARVRTISSHIENMITGVIRGYRYKMRLVYAHFPINVAIENDVKIVVRNFLGEKRPRVIDMLEGVTIQRSTGGVKDELVLEGNDLDNVSQSAASIQQSTLVRNKDIRKFLDGIYVSEKGHVVEED